MAKSGKSLRNKHAPLALLVGKNQVAAMEAYYAKCGVRVEHRKTECGDYEPILKDAAHFDAINRARGWN